MKSVHWIVLAIILLFIVAQCTDSSISPSPDNTNLSAHESTVPPQPACAIGVPYAGTIYVTSDDVNFRTEPNSKSPNVINQRATEVLGKTDYRLLSPEYALQGLCEKDDWVQAKIVQVDGGPVEWETGWLNKKFIAHDATADQQAGLFWRIDTEKAFSKKEKDLVRQGALKVLQDEVNCATITSGYRSGNKKGSYYVTCSARNGGAPFNVWFTPEDVKANKTLAVPAVYPEVQSREACEAAIKANVEHPSTLNINRIIGYATTAHNNGNRTIIQDFSAKNAFNLELKYQARCLIMPDGKLEISIKEEGN